MPAYELRRIGLIGKKKPSMKLYDHIEHSNMLGIFKRLYWDEDHSADTQVKLSIDLGVAERTLLRYRKQFVRAFLYNLEEVHGEMRSGDAGRVLPRAGADIRCG